MIGDRKIVTPDGTVTDAPKISLGGYTLEQMQEIVGGYIELVRLKDGRLMVVNEDGRSKGLEPNLLATEEARQGIVGTVLVCLDGDIH